ncbi:MAG TPA: TonB-dependent receptor [Terriglobia bacterium]|nr:TonB-dependent receptor [Terriglobia bacterium]
MTAKSRQYAKGSPSRVPAVRQYSRKAGRHVAFLLVAVMAPVPSLRAQVSSGSIVGYVYDPSGALIANAEVTVSDADRALVRTTRTNASGAYAVPELTPAVYTVSASAPGFAEMTQAGMQVEVNGQLRYDFHLSIAPVRKAVVVTASAPPMQAGSPELGAVIDQEQIASVPLNRRAFLQLALLAPGVTPPVQDSELSGYGAFSMNAGGGREEFNNYLLDGVDNNDPYVNRYDVEPPVDSIQEFKVATNTYSAEYGRSGAGQVNVITRQGSNNFHGELYEYVRNRVFDARNFFDPSSLPKLVRNQFGFAVGGPVIRNKTYFFASTDFFRDREGLSELSSVPTAEERQGNLSALGATLVNPFTGKPFAGNVIPSSFISPLAPAVLKMFPSPNLPGLSNNYLASPLQSENDTQGTYRVDHRLSASGDLMIRYSFGTVDLFEPWGGSSNGAPSTNTTPGFGDYVRDHAQNAMFQYRKSFSPRVINTAILAFNRFSRDILPQNYNVNVGQLWGVNWLKVPAAAYGYPGISVAGLSGIGDNYTYPDYRHTNTYEVSDSLAIDRGSHLLKLGGEVRDLQLNGILYYFSRGLLGFTGALSGSGISDLLLGLPTFGLQSQSTNPITLRTRDYNAYFEDDWRVSPRLTLNLGARYEYNGPAFDPTNRMSTLNFTSNQVMTVGTGGVSRSGIKPDWNNVAPRVGFAWSPDKSLVVRGGYGFYYDAGMLEVNSAMYFNPPQFNLLQFFPSAAGLLTLGNPFPTDTAYTPPASLNVLEPNIVTPYMQQWNLTVERAFPSIGTFTLGYAGSGGRNLVRGIDLNQPAPGPGDVQPRRPYPQYGDIFLISSDANSAYNSLQATFRREMGSHFSVWAAYTWSHSIDDQSAFLASTPDPNFPQNSQDPNAERANSSFDMRHRLVLTYVLRLPQQNRWTRNTELHGMTTVQSGRPLTPVLTFDNSNTGNTGGQTGSDRPNLVRNWNLPNPTATRWFDPGAFAVPPAYTFGNAGRNIIFGPGLASFDFAVARSFAITERFRLKFEAQAFNLFNRANFNLPQAYVDQPTFGQILSAQAPRQIQLALRFSF